MCTSTVGIWVHKVFSHTRWTHRCTIMVKNDGRKYFSSKHNVSTSSCCNLSRSDIRKVLEQITLKKEHKLVVATLTLLGKTPRVAIRSSCCIRTSQSRDLRLESVKFSKDTRLLKFDE